MQQICPNITFDDDGLGSFQFIAVVGFIDCQFSERDGHPLVEFSWQGHDDNDDACGRGWGIIANSIDECGHRGWAVKVALGSQPEVSDGHENVGFRG